MKNLKKLIYAASLFLIAGCGPVISEETLKTVDRAVRFEQVVKDPDAYKGRQVVFGGTILNVENGTEATYIEVLQEGMNSQLKPVDQDASRGRFLAEYKGFKDPAIYSPGKRLTVAGVVTGARTRELGKGTYKYPVIEAREDYLWEPRGYDRGPSIGIGIGLGYTHID